MSIEENLKEIRANRFVLEDENGNEYAALDAAPHGPELWMCGENGKPHVMLSVDKDELA